MCYQAYLLSLLTWHFIVGLGTCTLCLIAGVFRILFPPNPDGCHIQLELSPEELGHSRVKISGLWPEGMEGGREGRKDKKSEIVILAGFVIEG